MAIMTAIPMYAHADQKPVDASALGLRAPNAQEIQSEIDLVHSQGVAIRVIGHFTRPTMTVDYNGRALLASNVPIVEFEIGYIPGKTASGVQSTSGAFLQDHVVKSGTFDIHPSDSYYSWQWQDNANGSTGGYPTFYYSAHFNVTCTPTCINYMTTINHQANMSNTGYSLSWNDWSFSCSASFPNWWSGSGTSWGVEYYDPYNGSCKNQGTYMWAQGYWHKNSTYYTSYFSGNAQGTTSSPGDYLRF